MFGFLWLGSRVASAQSCMMCVCVPFRFYCSNIRIISCRRLSIIISILGMCLCVQFFHSTSILFFLSFFSCFVSFIWFSGSIPFLLSFLIRCAVTWGFLWYVDYEVQQQFFLMVYHNCPSLFTNSINNNRALQVCGAAREVNNSVVMHEKQVRVSSTSQSYAFTIYDGNCMNVKVTLAMHCSSTVDIA